MSTEWARTFVGVPRGSPFKRSTPRAPLQHNCGCRSFETLEQAYRD